MFYDLLHGIDSSAGIRDALELGVLIGFDGQLEQNSKTEEAILYNLIRSLYEAQFSGKERALIWLYVKTWNLYGEHLIEFKKYLSGDRNWFWYINYYEEKWQGLWSFGVDDMEAAFSSMALPKKEDSRIDRLNSRQFQILFSGQRSLSHIYSLNH